jgi:GntR family transcriptional regulator
MILQGILLPKDKLPSVRELSKRLQINPNTVSKAYQELKRQGIIDIVHGKGAFISENVNFRLREKKISIIKQSLKRLIFEASCLKVDRKTFIKWTESYLNEYYQNTENRSVIDKKIFY